MGLSSASIFNKPPSNAFPPLPPLTRDEPLSPADPPPLPDPPPLGSDDDPPVRGGKTPGIPAMPTR